MPSTDSFIHDACGVAMFVNIPNTIDNAVKVENSSSLFNAQESSHEIVTDAGAVLKSFEYRSGINPVTEESDGAGICFFGLPTPFFNEQIRKGKFLSTENQPLNDTVLKSGEFAVGQYFLDPDPAIAQNSKALIQDIAEKHGLTVLGWRALDSNFDVDRSKLSQSAKTKKPQICQALLQAKKIEATPVEEKNAPSFEKRIRFATIDMINTARENEDPLYIVSQSSESIVYKGMIYPSQLSEFYLDLKNPLFTANAVTLHGRFATNTNPQWKNAQPCPQFVSHNGELNSVSSNAADMLLTMRIRENTHGVLPNNQLSDSIQFDNDLLHLICTCNISLPEAFMRLMPPLYSEDYSPEINAMLECFRLERTPYNGPAFMVAGFNGYFVAKLDDCGLRPSRWALIQHKDGSRQFYAGSDDIWTAQEEYTVIRKGELAPGGMLVITPEGEILDTANILEWIATQYHKKNNTNFFFQGLIENHTHPIDPLHLAKESPQHAKQTLSSIEKETLNRLLFASGWDKETVSDVCAMAKQGRESTGAMGDDTDPLHMESMPAHISYFFHQLFAQVSAPSIDSIREIDRFNLNTSLGPQFFLDKPKAQISLPTPILNEAVMDELINQTHVKTTMLSLCFDINADTSEKDLNKALRHLCVEAEKVVRNGVGILILSDTKLALNRAAIPDLIAVAAVRLHLQRCKLAHLASLVVDSYQISGPHQAAALLCMGADAVYPRGAYTKIHEHYATDAAEYCLRYQSAQEKCLLKTMGKMGITDVNNYINGHFMAALGLNLSNADEPSGTLGLAELFRGIYSPLRGLQMGHIAKNQLERHQSAFNPKNRFNLMPRSGIYMPEKGGIIHGYGPETTPAFAAWMKEEEARASRFQLHLGAEEKKRPNYLSAKDLAFYEPEYGFLDPRKKNEAGFYLADYLERFKPSKAFQTMSGIIDGYNTKHPTALRHYLKINPNKEPTADPVQSQADIRKVLYSGSMSQGALTVEAHEALTEAVNAVGAMSGSGEGGEDPIALRSERRTAQSKQIASGRFGVSAMQILYAEEIEIKIVQGAKPGEGGELPGTKVSIRFAAQRGGLPGTSFISPPPHHDIYSIEDLAQLIRDIKAVKPSVKVAVKLVASQGIGTIAIGVAKAGADVINIASNSGGTGAAQQSSIKHAGLPSEIGLAEVDRALKIAGLRDLVSLRTSGGFKTANDILIAAILGADQFELGTTSMLTLGCRMQRTCYDSCQPGVAADGHLFQREQVNTELYYVNLAAEIQRKLKEMGVSSLAALRGRTELLDLFNPNIKEFYDFSLLLDNPNLYAQPTKNAIEKARRSQSAYFKNLKEEALIKKISLFFDRHSDAVFTSESIALDTQDWSFGARIAGYFAAYLDAHPNAKIILNTKGNAGQSFAFVLPKGMKIRHVGSVQDGCAKSMTGGELILKTPAYSKKYNSEENTLVGNAFAYGASGGKIFVNGIAGHRCGILCKNGLQIVVEGTGDLPFEYMTGGTALILGKTGKGLGTGATGGIIIQYHSEPAPKENPSDSVYICTHSAPYKKAILRMLKEHVAKTGSIQGQSILDHFNMHYFSIYIPKELNKINTLSHVIAVLKTFSHRQAPLTVGVEIWLQEKIIEILEAEHYSEKKLDAFKQLLNTKDFNLFSGQAKIKIRKALNLKTKPENLGIEIKSLSIKKEISSSTPYIFFENSEIAVQIKTPTHLRLASVHGTLDTEFLDALSHINRYVNALSVDAQGCSTCKAQSCSGGDALQTGCPSGKPINTINATLQRLGQIPANGRLYMSQWRILREAFELQIKETPFFGYTGAACPAPCQADCTEGIPNPVAPIIGRGGKPVGEPVHIKDIEYLLYQVGRFLGWFDGERKWTQKEIDSIFRSDDNELDAYNDLMAAFSPAFQRAEVQPCPDKTLIIVGSGPAAMQLAFEALQDGLQVEMYEKSDKAGGLLADGIPAHKFDKIYLDEDFNRLKKMGLKLHLKHEVQYDPKQDEYYAVHENAKIHIAHRGDKNKIVVLCLGAGLPRTLGSKATQDLDPSGRRKIIQAVDFLKAANDVAYHLKKNPSLSPQEQEAFIKEMLGEMDPRGKKILVIGGGDTAQDAIRWTARYIANSPKIEGNVQLNIVVRGPEPSAPPTKEGLLKAEEVTHIGGNTSYDTEIETIIPNANGKLTIKVKQSKLKYYEFIKSSPELYRFFNKIPREERSVEHIEYFAIEDVDIIMCALGANEKESIPLIKALLKENGPAPIVAGDSAGTRIIVEAQESAKRLYHKQIRAAIDIKMPVDTTTTPRPLSR